MDTVVGLFSGIGGLEIALSQAGFESELMVEKDPQAAAVLRSRFPRTRILPDVLDLKDLPAGTSMVAAGFPCQNLSMAGDKAGIEGSKSSVVFKMFELIERSRVPTVLIENVYFMLHLDSGRAMNWIAGRFEEMGYRWAYRVLDSLGFGLPQRRRRVYMVASRSIDPTEVLFADDREAVPEPAPNLGRPLGFYWTEGRSGVGITVDAIPPLKVGSGVGIPSAPAVLFPDGDVLTPDLETCERLQGFVGGWTEAAETVPGRKASRWRLVGNAVSVPVATWVAERIRQPGTVLPFELTETRKWRRWPDAAWNMGHGRVGVAAGDKPVGTVRPSIGDYRSSGWQPLSVRALGGFIGRAEEGRLRMPSGFLESLRAALGRRADGTAVRASVP